MKNRSVLGIIFGSLLCNSCAPTVPEITDYRTYEPEKQKWDSYGAYIEREELLLEAIVRPGNEGGTATASQRHFRRRLVILNEKGLKYSTMIFNHENGTVLLFDAKLWDSLGHEVILDIKKMKKEYVEKSAIIFNGAMVGSVLEVEILKESNDYYPAIEHWFVNPLPILNCLFQFEFDSHSYDYEAKEHGSVPPGTFYEKFYKKNGYVWELKNVIPPSRIENSKILDEQFPAIFLAVRRVFDNKYYTWKQNARLFKRWQMAESIFPGSFKMDKIVEELISTEKNDYDRANAILSWVQNNITQEGNNRKTFEADQIIKSGKADNLETAILLKKMLEKAKIGSKIVMSRRASLGGFMRDFPFTNSLDMPFVQVEAGRKSYLAYPYVRGFLLGQYPSDYFGMSGLLIPSGELIDLPKPNFSISKKLIGYDINILEASVTVKQKYMGLAAENLKRESFRNDCFDLKKNLESELKEMSPENKVESITGKLSVYKEDTVEAKFTFSNPTLVITKRNENLVRLEPLFPVFFMGYDTSRVSDYTVQYRQESVIRITFENKNLSMGELHWQCQELKNELFSLKCNQVNMPLTLEAIITINQFTVSASRMRQLSLQIATLNQIRESYVSFK